MEKLTLDPARRHHQRGGNTANPLPQLLQTPSGLALLEMQGTINLPEHDDEDTISTGDVKSQETPIGRLVFPDYDEQAPPGNNDWMKRVYLYVGKHQRMTGEVKQLPKALAVIRKVKREDEKMGEEDEEKTEELEVVEIVKYKIIFSIRPEPVGALAAAEAT
jgi:chromosome transmission fidelity protein 8